MKISDIKWKNIEVFQKGSNYLIFVLKSFPILKIFYQFQFKRKMKIFFIPSTDIDLLSISNKYLYLLDMIEIITVIMHTID